MKKEILVAIIIGFALGLIITFGIWTTNQSLKKQASSQKPNQIEETTPTPTTEELSLLVASPEDNSISAEEKITVSGKTAPQATVIILYPEGELVTQANDEGSFTGNITLSGGANEIEVVAYDEKGNEVSQLLNVVYSTAEI